MSSVPGFVTGDIGLLVIHSIAISTTVFRLSYRYRRRQLQWDDFWALFAMLCDVVNVAAFVVLSLVDLTTKPVSTISFIFWSTVTFTPAQIWATRLSIAVTMVRFLPAGRLRLISILGCWGLVVLWAVFTLQEVFICGFPLPVTPFCPSKSAPIVFIICNIIGSLWLVCWPAYVLISMRYRLLSLTQTRIPATHHRLLIACFSTSILLLIVNISHDIFLFKNDLINLTITGHIEIAVSLFLCNILVLVTYVYRLISTPHASDAHSYPSTASSRFTGGISGGRSNPFPMTQVYTSTQIYTLTEYPPSSGHGMALSTSKERRASMDTIYSDSKKYLQDLVPADIV